MNVYINIHTYYNRNIYMYVLLYILYSPQVPKVIQIENSLSARSPPRLPTSHQNSHTKFCFTKCFNCTGLITNSGFNTRKSLRYI